jgi:hypothetical protein
VKLSRLLFASSVVFYVFYDIISTLAAFDYLGTFQYEKSLLLKTSFDMGGVPGFILMKLVFSLLALYLAYLLIERFPRFRGIGLGILGGATAAGIFVGSSNLNIIFNGSSFWFLGIDSGTLAAVIIVACAALGYLLTPAEKPAGTY